MDTLTIPEIAKIYMVSEESVRRWISKGVKGEKLKAINEGRTRVVKRTDWDEFLELTNAKV